VNSFLFLLYLFVNIYLYWSKMNVYYLSKSEIKYELKIRGECIEGSASELRNRLSKCVRDNKAVNDEIVNSLCVTDELRDCEDKFLELSSLEAEFEGELDNVEKQRIRTRLTHAYRRVKRIPLGDTPDEDNKFCFEGLVKRFETLLDLYHIEYDRGVEEEDLGRNVNDNQFLENPIETVDSSASNVMFPKDGDSRVSLRGYGKGDKTGSIPNTPLECSEINSKTPFSGPPSRSKAIPVYKWGLKFDGRSQSIGSFLQRVEELRRARGVTTTELFDSAVDLFSGPALIWYRSTIGRIFTWETLSREMKIVFQSPDHDFRLQQEIFNRIQGDTESIDMFIAVMEGLYDRLATNVPEEVRLKQIIHNLSPQLQDRLALFDIDSIEELRKLGRKAEAGRWRANFPRSESTNLRVLEPDLAYEPLQSRAAPKFPLELQPPKEIRAECWNCGEIGHRHTTCAKEKRKFCYGCGAPNVFRNTCKKCANTSDQFNRSKNV
jgi:hypothetical protein